jgi:hypothetical protein
LVAATHGRRAISGRFLFTGSFSTQRGRHDIHFYSATGIDSGKQRKTDGSGQGVSMNAVAAMNENFATQARSACHFGFRVKIRPASWMVASSQPSLRSACGDLPNAF